MRVRLAVLLVCLSAAGGCIGYTGEARELPPSVWRHESGWIAVDGVPLFRQRAEHDCGPTALAMVLAYWHAPLTKKRLAEFPENRQASAGELRDRAQALGLSAFVVAGTLKDIAHELSAKRPVIVGVAKPTSKGAIAHYEVVVGLHPSSQRIATLDPNAGWRQNSLVGFMREWMPTGSVLLVVLPQPTRVPPRSTSGQPKEAVPAVRAAVDADPEEAEAQAAQESSRTRGH